MARPTKRVEVHTPLQGDREYNAKTAKRFRAAYDLPLVVDLDFTKVTDGRTQQQFTDTCDINKIMERWINTGQVTHINRKTGIYGDFSEIQSFDQALNQILDAEAQFMEMPAELRDRFNNDAGQLIRFMDDPKNLEEGRQLGLFKPDDPGMQNDAKSPGAEKTSTKVEQKVELTEKTAPPIIGGESP